MILLDLTLSSPSENLALDEALLLEREKAAREKPLSPAQEVLRFWESPAYFVALGVSQKLETDVDIESCAREGVPLLRRASGGGTVLQGPGCLNFTLVLSLDVHPELRDLKRSFSVILDVMARGLGLEDISHQGISDLAMGGQKVSGNAQKRTAHVLLHHGTLLHAFDPSRVARYLKEPEKQPEYRERRTHKAFLKNLPLRAEEIKSMIARAWGAARPDSFEIPPLGLLLREKYESWAWTEKF